MRKLLLILFLLQNTILIFGQDRIFSCSYNSDNFSHGCDIINANSDNNIYDQNVHQKVREILTHIALPTNFILAKCDGIDNAIAYTDPSGSRYIIIDERWISSFSSNNWFIISVLAHEIGHHLSGHTIKAPTSLSERRERELEADKFSGFILKKMGANLDQSLTSINILVPNDYNDVNSTHPTRNKRISAITKGFNGSSDDVIDNQDFTVNVNSIEILYNRALSKVSLANYKFASSADLMDAAILHKDIVSKREFGPSLLILSFIYAELIERKLLGVDYNLTVINYSERANATHYNINGYGSFEVFNNIGYAYNLLASHYNNYKYYNSAIENLNASISLNSSIPMSYHNRGIAYWNLGNNFRQPTAPQACQDFYNACYLGRKEACNIYNRACLTR